MTTYPYKSAYICSGICQKRIIVKNGYVAHWLEIGKPIICDSCRNGIDTSTMTYKQYLQTEAWKQRAEMCRQFWGNRCALCNSNSPLEVHHRTYERLGEETNTDIIALCQKCHTKHHDIEDNENEQ